MLAEEYVKFPFNKGGAGESSLNELKDEEDANPLEYFEI